MPKRICSACGKEKDVRGGKECENGHFICKQCVWSGLSKECPLCGKHLR